MTHLTIREASQLIGRTPATVRRYIRSGRLPALKEIGKFGEEYKILRDDLLALGLSPSSSDLPVKVDEDTAIAPRSAVPQDSVSIALYNELLMKHEQILVQYGMIRAGGQKLLEFKADAEAKAEELIHSQERYQALRTRALREIDLLRKQVRQARVEIEDRNIEIALLQEKIKRLEMTAPVQISKDHFDAQVAEIREKERAIAKLEVAAGGGPSATIGVPGAWMQGYPPDGREEDH
jgi:excisionase family DNA binding protein